MSRARAILYFILACLFGLVVHYVAFPILHWTPASLACPALCEGCEPSMRQLYEVSGYGSTSTVSNYTYVCRSSKVDIDGASVSDVEGARKEELAPYRVNGLLVALIETVFGLFFLVPYLRRRGMLAEKREEGELAARLADAETELRAAYRGRADESGAAPYR